jgi:uncharacterized protein YqkB
MHNRNEPKPLGRNEYQHQVARTSNEYAVYDTAANDYQTAADYSNFNYDWMPSKPKAYASEPMNNTNYNTDSAASAYQGISRFNNFNYNGNVRQYESAGLENISYNRSSAYSYQDHMHSDFSERYSSEQYPPHYAARNVDDIPVSPPFFLAKRGHGDAHREEYPVQPDYSVDPRSKEYSYDPFSVQYDYPQPNDRSNANNNTVSPVQLTDNFERDYVNQRQRYVKDWLSKERSRIQGKDSFTPKSILKNSNKVEDRDKYAYGTEKLSCNNSSGLFFRRQNASFGTVSVGSLSRMKLELCNATENQVKIIIEDPKLPFVLLHNEINMQPRSYVRIPIRFVPVVKREFRAELIAKAENDGLVAKIVITGSSM